ncbi:EAL domain-containing protein (putative c-di-GMP-specific phosphodiesterase class I) [Hypnocyclicus thermotrophus]|uniref:EAL domain-containing protein (Putative c-di-GMP-specific phosphodiesterase class I) n=1 Tax=Hypnocyclicus thermotrophus TaxID=1627895 RepID=A0AA46E098_9FUSO|nr:EAL domain-containing protein [Hypnocyclicus thermotrophus]TDT71941.1 EAL domain-containing protein (putative c-di-GMP-specific phosphodiesterase class I) [Hypnocyclicus thermotrophus]
MLGLAEKETLLNIEEKIELSSYFQPIISLKENKIIGYELLLRGIINKEVISPENIYNVFESNNELIDFDFKVVKHHIKEISKIYNENYLYSVNISFPNKKLSTIDETMLKININEIVEKIKKYRMDTKNIIIEISENEVVSTGVQIAFVNQLKEKGFLVALDDVGKNNSNFSKLVDLKPDILKIDKSLIKDIEKSGYKSSIVKNIISIAEETGSIVITEGVEKIEELEKITWLGCDLVQGYFYSKAMEIKKIDIYNIINKIEWGKNKVIQYIDMRMKQIIDNEIICNDIILQAERTFVLFGNEFAAFSYNLFRKFSKIEAVYLLNEKGIQISDTFLNKEIKIKKNKIFHPARIGDNHNLKEYYYNLKYKEMYVSDVYISKATGNRCITISKKIINNILCVDIKI